MKKVLSQICKRFLPFFEPKFYNRFLKGHIIRSAYFNTILNTQLSIPTHAQLQRHRLKFIKKSSKKLLHVSVYDHLQGVIMSSLK